MTQANDDPNLAVLFLMAARALGDELHRQLDETIYSDTRPAHGFTFQLLAPNGATINEIAEHLGVTKQAASQMVEFLEQHGYVSRQPHPVDKRNKLVLLTDKGWGCTNTVANILNKLEQQWSDLLGSERLEIMRSDLSRLILETNEGKWPSKLRPSW